jgi:hypothetical protein
MGKHSGCTVVIASHGWQSRIDSPTNPEQKRNTYYYYYYYYYYCPLRSHWNIGPQQVFF